MLRLRTRLQELEKDKNPIRVAVVGAGETDTGQKGATLVQQIEGVQGMRVIAVADNCIEDALEGLKKSEGNIEHTEDAYQASSVIHEGKRIITQNVHMVSEIPDVQVVVIAVKDANVAARCAFQCILQKKHLIMLNALADLTVGLFLKQMADNAGVVYTFSIGDEPGITLELCNFAWLLGLEVLAAGKGKNNPLQLSATPDELRNAAQEKGVSAQVLTSFVDGTKTMLEMTVLANATGLIPDVRGMHGPKCSVDDLLSIFCLKEKGGILEREGVVDYVIGDVAPGVFAIVRTEQKSFLKELHYLKMGEGPNYLLYRPYHLGTLETPVSIARAFFDKESSIVPLKQPVAETIAVAKRDLKVGEIIDEIGGYATYGLIEKKDIAERENYLPLGLAKGARLLSEVKKGEVISCSKVSLDHSQFLITLRTLQERR
ncbi:NAD(P)-dependent oxidoreductase [Candidatus Aerophobetes bacterium]|nr:NAD(P)-dependent oxidoreductase [Candidatus Aerophobetes bacterium]